MSLEERKKSSMDRAWKKLRRLARQLSDAQGDVFLTPAKQDLLSCFAMCTSPADLAANAALEAAAGQFGGTLADAGAAWLLPQRMADVLERPGGEENRYELEEMAMAFRDVVKAAVQLAQTRAVLRQELVLRGNACLARLAESFEASGLEISIPPLPVPEDFAAPGERLREAKTISQNERETETQKFSGCDEEMPAAEGPEEIQETEETEEPAGDDALDWSDTYLQDARELQAGFLQQCHAVDIQLDDAALRTLSYAGEVTFLDPGVQDGRQVSFYFWRAIRHQAERLAAQADDVDVLTAEDIAAAFDIAADAKDEGFQGADVWNR